MLLSQHGKEEQRLRLRDVIFGVLILISIGAWVVGGILLYQEMMT